MANIPQIDPDWLAQLYNSSGGAPAQNGANESITNIDIHTLVPDPCQEIVPFRMASPERMSALVEDIRRNGILSPLLVRQLPDGYYGILAGRARKQAAERLQYTTVPCIVKDPLDEDAALAILVSDNMMNRTELLPSEKAFAYKTQLEILDRQGERVDLGTSHATSGHDGQKLSRDTVAELYAESSRQVQRYIRLTHLIPELLELVDAAKIGLVVAEQISFISEDGQVEIWSYFYSDKKPKPLSKELAALMRIVDADPERQLDADEIDTLVSDRKIDQRTPKVAKIPLKDLRQHIPAGLTRQQITQYIIEAVIAFQNQPHSGST